MKTKQRILSIILAISMVLSFIPTGVGAVDDVVCELCNDEDTNCYGFDGTSEWQCVWRPDLVGASTRAPGTSNRNVVVNANDDGFGLRLGSGDTNALSILSDGTISFKVLRVSPRIDIVAAGSSTANVATAGLAFAPVFGENYLLSFEAENPDRDGPATNMAIRRGENATNLTPVTGNRFEAEFTPNDEINSSADGNGRAAVTIQRSTPSAFSAEHDVFISNIVIYGESDAKVVYDCDLCQDSDELCIGFDDENTLQCVWRPDFTKLMIEGGSATRVNNGVGIDSNSGGSRFARTGGDPTPLVNNRLTNTVTENGQGFDIYASASGYAAAAARWNATNGFNPTLGTAYKLAFTGTSSTTRIMRIGANQEDPDSSGYFALVAEEPQDIVHNFVVGMENAHIRVRFFEDTDATPGGHGTLDIDDLVIYEDFDPQDDPGPGGPDPVDPVEEVSVELQARTTAWSHTVLRGEPTVVAGNGEYSVTLSGDLETKDFTGLAIRSVGASEDGEDGWATVGTSVLAPEEYADATITIDSITAIGGTVNAVLTKNVDLPFVRTWEPLTGRVNTELWNPWSPDDQRLEEGGGITFEENGGVGEEWFSAKFPDTITSVVVNFTISGYAEDDIVEPQPEDGMPVQLMLRATAGSSAWGLQTSQTTFITEEDDKTYSISMNVANNSNALANLAVRAPGAIWGDEGNEVGDAELALEEFENATVTVTSVVLNGDDVIDLIDCENIPLIQQGDDPLAGYANFELWNAWYDGYQRFESGTVNNDGYWSHSSAITSVTVTFTIDMNGLDSGPEPEPTPEIGIDFVNEFLTGFDFEGTYTVNDDIFTPPSANVPIGAHQFGRTLRIIKKGDGVDTLDSEQQTLVVPAKAAAPTGVAAVDCTTVDNNDGQITGVDSTMQYRPQNGLWSSVTDTTVTGLAPGIYHVRVKATDSAFASDITAVEVEAFGEVEPDTLEEDIEAMVRMLTNRNSGEDLSDIILDSFELELTFEEQQILELGGDSVAIGLPVEELDYDVSDYAFAFFGMSSTPLAVLEDVFGTGELDQDGDYVVIELEALADIVTLVAIPLNDPCADGHDLSAVVVTLPTCEDDGFITTGCINCEYFEVTPGAPATGHTIDFEVNCMVCIECGDNSDQRECSESNPCAFHYVPCEFCDDEGCCVCQEPCMTCGCEICFADSEGKCGVCIECRLPIVLSDLVDVQGNIDDVVIRTDLGVDSTFTVDDGSDEGLEILIIADDFDCLVCGETGEDCECDDKVTWDEFIAGLEITVTKIPIEPATEPEESPLANFLKGILDFLKS